MRQAGGTPPGPLHVRPEPPQRGLFTEETQDGASRAFSAAARRKGGAEGLDWEVRTSGANCHTRTDNSEARPHSAGKRTLSILR